MAKSNAAMVIQSIFPDGDYRRICLSMFAEAIQKAASLGTDKWGVHCESGRVRLLIGNLIVFTLEEGKAWFCLDQETLKSSKESRKFLKDYRSWHLDQDSYPRYISPPSLNGYYIPSEDHAQLWPQLRSLHFAYQEKVADKFIWLRSNSQTRHRSDVLAYLRQELHQDIPDPDYRQEFTFAEEMTEEIKTFPEGGKKIVTVNAYERNPEARDACIMAFRAHCAVCGFDFAKVYGPIGEGFIHVHHLKPLSEIQIGYEVDPEEDLRPVCPNCHAMLHRRKPPYSIEELRDMMKKVKVARRRKAHDTGPESDNSEPG